MYDIQVLRSCVRPMLAFEVAICSMRINQVANANIRLLGSFGIIVLAIGRCHSNLSVMPRAYSPTHSLTTSTTRYLFRQFHMSCLLKWYKLSCQVYIHVQDPNINISLPIFIIHGNHDDLTAKGIVDRLPFCLQAMRLIIRLFYCLGLSALDIFHESGLLNLFGKHENFDQIEVWPVLLKKGATKLAIYGIGSQRDDRLYRALRDQKVIRSLISIAIDALYALFYEALDLLLM